MVTILEYHECYLCGKQVSEEMYCFGCQEYICDECDVGHCIGFNHKPEDHLNPDWEEENE